jgi:hypothetical protein
MAGWMRTEWLTTSSRVPYIKAAWCIFVIENAVHSEPQETNRWRFWATIPELDGRYLRVVTLEA